MTRTECVGALVFLAACSVLHTDAYAQSRRDSAGIVIRDMRLTGPQSRLLLSSKPTIDLGADDASGPYEFHRVSAVVRRRDSVLIVANGGTLELRFFGSNGRHIRTVGRKGAGPGEFQAIDKTLVLAGDSILVADNRQQRYVLFSPQGNHVRTVSLSAADGRRTPDLLFVLLDGTMVVGSVDISTVPPRAEPYYFTQRLTTATSDGRPGRVIGTFGVSEHFVQQVPREQGGIAYWNLAYGRTMTVAARDNRILAGDGTAFELRYYSRAGALMEILRANEPPTVLTAEHRATYRAMLLAGSRDTAAMNKRAAEMPYPRTVPAFKQFFVAQDGRIWIQRYPRPTPGRDQWIVLDTAGQFIDEVAMPPRFVLMQAGSNYVVGVGRDADGVEHPQVIPFTIKP